MRSRRFSYPHDRRDLRPALSDPSTGLQWGTIADWVVAVTTIVLAAVAVFQDWIRAIVFAPDLRVSLRTQPPDCVWVPFTASGRFFSNTIHVRLYVENAGHQAAVDVEVYAKALRCLEGGGRWRRVETFPPMNLIWADVGGLHVASMAPQTGRHCDLGHIMDPAERHLAAKETNSSLNLTAAQTSFTFALAVQPNHKGDIVPPGTYQLDVVVAARNARTLRATLGIVVDGRWFKTEDQMLASGIHVEVVEQSF